MSRRVIRDDDAYEVVVGWDPPLAQWFVQVFDKSVHEDANPTVWEMGTDVFRVMDYARPYMRIIEHAKAIHQLMQDEENNA